MYRFSVKIDITMESNEDTKKSNKFPITIEPAIFLLTLGGIIQLVVIQNLYLDKVCLVNFQMNASLCNNKNQSEDNATDSTLADRVQSYVSGLNIYNSIINCVPSIFFVLFLGPWSDAHGRKPLMILPTAGCCLSTLIFMANYFWDSWPAEYLLLASLPASLLGGFGAFGMAVTSYIVDTSTEEERTTRISIFSGVVMLAGPLGNFISGYIFQYGGYWAVFASSLACSSSSLAYFIFSVKESRPPKQKRFEPFHKECFGITKNLWKCFAVTFKAREGHKRLCICILLAMMCLLTFANSPEGVGFLYTRKKFGWEAHDFTLYLTAYFSFIVFGNLVVLPLLNGYFHVSDGVIGMIGLASDFVTCLAAAFVTSGLVFYISSIVLVLTCGTGVVIRSGISKLVDPDELGHIFSVLACLESINPLISSTIINLIYQATLEIFPGAVFIIGASLDIVLMALFSLVLYLLRNGNGSNSRETNNNNHPGFRD